MNYTEWLEEIRSSLRNDHQYSWDEIDHKIDSLTLCEGVYLNELYHKGWSVYEVVEHLA